MARNIFKDYLDYDKNFLKEYINTITEKKINSKICDMIIDTYINIRYFNNYEPVKATIIDNIEYYVVNNYIRDYIEKDLIIFQLPENTGNLTIRAGHISGQSRNNFIRAVFSGLKRSPEESAWFFQFLPGWSPALASSGYFPAVFHRPVQSPEAHGWVPCFLMCTHCRLKQKSQPDQGAAAMLRFQFLQKKNGSYWAADLRGARSARHPVHAPESC